MLEQNKLDTYLLSSYNKAHEYKSDKSLYEYVIDIKNDCLKKDINALAKIFGYLWSCGIFPNAVVHLSCFLFSKKKENTNI